MFVWLIDCLTGPVIHNCILPLIDWLSSPNDFSHRLIDWLIEFHPFIDWLSDLRPSLVISITGNTSLFAKDLTKWLALGFFGILRLFGSSGAIRNTQNITVNSLVQKQRPLRGCTLRLWWRTRWSPLSFGIHHRQSAPVPVKLRLHQVAAGSDPVEKDHIPTLSSRPVVPTQHTRRHHTAERGHNHRGRGASVIRLGLLTRARVGRPFAVAVLKCLIAHGADTVFPHLKVFQFGLEVPAGRADDLQSKRNPLLRNQNREKTIYFWYFYFKVKPLGWLEFRF